jgi:hypothetical protein
MFFKLRFMSKTNLSRYQRRVPHMTGPTNINSRWESSRQQVCHFFNMALFILENLFIIIIVAYKAVVWIDPDLVGSANG